MLTQSFQNEQYKRFFKLFLMKIGATIIALCILLILRERLDPNGFGYYSAFVTVTSLSLVPIIQGIKSLYARESKVMDIERNRLFHYILVTMLYMFFLLFVFLIFNVLGWRESVLNEYLVIFLCIPAALFITYRSVTEQVAGVGAKSQRYESLIRPLIFLLLILFFVVIDYISPSLVVACFVASYLICGGYVFSNLLKLIGEVGFFESCIGVFNNFYLLLKSSVTLLLSAVFQALPILYLTATGYLSEVGDYYFSDRVSQMVLLPLLGLNMMAALDFSKIASVNMKEGLLKEYYFNFFKVALPIWIVSFFSVISLGSFFSSLFQFEYFDQYLVSILMVAYLANLLSGPIVIALIQINNELKVILVTVVVIFVFFVLVFFSDGALIDIAISFLISNFLYRFVLFFIFYKGVRFE